MSKPNSRNINPFPIEEPLLKAEEVHSLLLVILSSDSGDKHLEGTLNLIQAVLGKALHDIRNGLFPWEEK